MLFISFSSIFSLILIFICLYELLSTLSFKSAFNKILNKSSLYIPQANACLILFLFSLFIDEIKNLGKPFFSYLFSL